MSARKHRNRDEQIRVLEKLGEKGQIHIGSKKDITKAIAQLEKIGAVKRIRVVTGSFFGPHIKHTKIVKA